MKINKSLILNTKIKTVKLSRNTRDSPLTALRKVASFIGQYG
jgi:hypothetical protein